MNQVFLKQIFRYLDCNFTVNLTHLTRATTSIDRIVLHRGDPVNSRAFVDEISNVFALSMEIALKCMEAWLVRTILLHKRELEYFPEIGKSVDGFDEDTALNNVRSMMGWCSQFI